MATPETPQSPSPPSDRVPVDGFGTLMSRFRKRERLPGNLLTQAELAEKTGYSTSYIRVLERGKGRPSDEFLLALFEQLTLSSEERARLEAAAHRLPAKPPPRASEREQLARHDPTETPAKDVDQAARVIGRIISVPDRYQRWLSAVTALLTFLLVCLAAVVALNPSRGLPAPSSPTVSQQVTIGGIWITPANGQRFHRALRWAVRAYARYPGHPKIAYVNFTVSWAGRPGPWLVACQLHHARSIDGFSDVYTCLWNPAKRHQHVPRGALTISFDVYGGGQRNLSPNGARTVYYTGTY